MVKSNYLEGIDVPPNKFCTEKMTWPLGICKKNVLFEKAVVLKEIIEVFFCT